MKPVQTGKVFLVGAGCGDPDLITVKGMRCVQEADVILTDRLVSPEIIQRYASPSAKVIYVGKQCRKGDSTPQPTINELMVLFAQDGKRVVRLKGGDVSIFSNILDELEALVQNGIAYEIIPGITAALGAAAYAGMPLTARNHAAAVRFLTAYRPATLPESYWEELARTNDTLVFYMSSETLPEVVKKLKEKHISAEKQLAVVEQATTPEQQVHTCSFHDYPATLFRKSFRSPTIVIIGSVVPLHSRYQWRPEKPQPSAYFQTGAMVANETLSEMQTA